MTPEAQRIAIAEAVDPDTYLPFAGRIIRGEPIWLTVNASPITCPDYLSDLNAMHEAEKEGLRTTSQWDAYQQTITHATAAQRAEAFLRTLNLWDDTK